MGAALRAERGVPYSEKNPYNMGVYLDELIQAASNLIREFPDANVAGTGILALMDVIEERASRLSELLDAAALNELWPEMALALERDPTLGLRAAGGTDDGPSG